MQQPASDLKNIVEAALLAAGRPLSIEAIQALFPELECPEKPALRSALEQLSEDYQGRGIEIAEVSSGWRIQVREACSPWVSRLWAERPARYSRALMETLALIAYRQPITRGEVEDIRGVSVSTNIVKTLMEREWVRVLGHRDVPGRPALYGTTREFLDYFGLRSLDELPTLAELRDLDEINRELDLNDPERPGKPDAGASAAQAEPADDATVGQAVPADDARAAQAEPADGATVGQAVPADDARAAQAEPADDVGHSPTYRDAEGEVGRRDLDEINREVDVDDPDRPGKPEEGASVGQAVPADDARAAQAEPADDVGHSPTYRDAGGDVGHGAADERAAGDTGQDAAPADATGTLDGAPDNASGAEQQAEPAPGRR